MKVTRGIIAITIIVTSVMISISGFSIEVFKQSPTPAQLGSCFQTVILVSVTMLIAVILQFLKKLRLASPAKNQVIFNFLILITCLRKSEQMELWQQKLPNTIP